MPKIKNLNKCVAVPSAPSARLKKALKPIDLLIKESKRDRASQLRNEKKYREISVVRKKDEYGTEYVSVLIVGDATKDWFRNYIPDSQSYNRVPNFSPNQLLDHAENIKNHCEGGHVFLGEITEFIDFELGETIHRAKELLKDGMITFDLLWCLFKPATDCYATFEDKLNAGTIAQSTYERNFFGTTFVITANQVDTDGKGFKLVQTQFKVPSFKGIMPISNLAVHPMDEKTKAKLVERGRKFEKYALGSNYVHCTGNLMMRSYFKNILFRSDGRIMIDVANFDKKNPNYASSNYGRDSEENFEVIAEDKLHVTVPYIKGFSFPLKKWGEFAIDDLSEIKFNENAFDTLVLDQDKKDIISALVKNADAGFTDIIKGKSGGCIFLLHGPPGVGKTLTSEAIAETMKAPLYSVSVGELGINPGELEEKLREILDIASTWKAQILIDEADIFLERRNENDIIRNAMVGVFLRLLEYHQGILFLTTNRVKNIDEAFYSRISVALHYKTLSVADRKKIWTNLLKCAGVNGLDVNDLANHNVNGRQIKTTIRLAQALAREKNEKVSMKHILATISIQEQFVDQLSQMNKTKKLEQLNG
jgi:hypothetical protein